MTGKDGITRRRVVAIGGGLVLLGGLGGTGTASEHDEEETDEGADDDYPTESRARAAHLSPDAPDVDVYVDGDLVLEDATYPSVSDYVDLEPGTPTVSIVPAGQDVDQAVVEETIDVTDEEYPDGDYTVAAIGEVAAENQPLQALVLEDDNSPTEPGAARVRAVHASPDAPAVDVVVEETGDALFEDVAFGEFGYVDVPEGEYTLLIYPAGDRTEAVFEVDVSPAAGTVYSAFAVGYLTPEEAPADEPLDVILTEDAAPGEA
ncbi:DUF4397 domain-containing protein [Natronobeatus ordinarius]|uniref:DUF4397 domain-containing protein n=1 Tax=Natronobeatus ordinarius TaxID=2963433 RepID=UPI0020CB7444|nr:DUF4397 domain-containing protein [Natronobeatus ordinarius]